MATGLTGIVLVCRQKGTRIFRKVPQSLFPTSPVSKNDCELLSRLKNMQCSQWSVITRHFILTLPNLNLPYMFKNIHRHPPLF